MAAGDYASHFLFYGRQVLHGYGFGKEEVVVKPVIDSWADAELGAGVEVKHRLGHYMGG